MKYKLLYVVIVVSSTVILSSCGKKKNSQRVSTSVRDGNASQADVSLTDAQRILSMLPLARCPLISFMG